MSNLLKISLDPGFGSFKASTVVNGKIVNTILPSLVGMGETSLGLLQTGITKQKRLLPHTIVLDGGQTLLTGQYVNLYARPSQRLDIERLGDSIEQRALTFSILGLLVQQIAQEGAITKENCIDTGLIVALPVHVLQGSDAKSVVQSLETWIVGDHEFSLDGSIYHLNVHEIRAMAQPLGSFFDWGLNNEGQWIRSAADLKSSVAVLDQGFNTLDLFHLSGGQIVRRFTDGETLGMRRAAKAMQDLMLQKVDRRVSLNEADEYIRQACNGHRFNLVYKGVSLDLKPLVQQALDMAASEVKSFLSQTWEDGKGFDYILLTGGGILALGDRLRNAYPNSIHLPDPVTANARGLAKYAQRPGVLAQDKQVA